MSAEIETTYLPASELTVRVSVPPEATQIGGSLPALLTEAHALRVNSHTAAEAAAALLGAVKGRAKSLDERRRVMTRPLDHAKQSAMALFNPALGALALAEAHLKSQLGIWQTTQRQLANVR